MRLLVTRPDADAQSTASKLRARGCEVLLAPLLHIESIAADFGPGPWDAVAITSVNAVRALEDHPRRNDLLRLPLFVVGRRTAAAGRELGFDDVVSADGNAKDLARLIAARAPGTTLLYLAGEDRANELAVAGMRVQTVAVYRAGKASQFPAAAGEAIAAGRLDGVLHYSRRSAEAFIACAKAAGVLPNALAAVHYCLSNQVAEPLRSAGAGNIRIAARPQETALLDLIERPEA